MKSRIPGILVGLAVLIFSTQAQALTMEYVTYNGFDAIVMAFQKIALIFSDGGYKGLFAAVIVMGMLLGAVGAMTRAATGAKGSPVSWGIPVMIGVILYLGLVIPKGTIVVHDEVLNKSRTIGDIPDGIVLVAGVMNKVERGLVDIVSTGSEPTSYQQQAGGIGFDMLLDIEYKGVLFSDQYLHASLNDYTKDCVFFELVRPGSTLNINQLAKNDNFLDLYDEAKSQAIYTVVYSEANPRGTTETCGDAWPIIKDQLKNATNYDKIAQARCADAGFDPTNPTELNQCKTILSNTVNYIQNAAYSYLLYFQQKVVSDSLMQALSTVSPNTVTEIYGSRDKGNSALASGIMFGKWLPSIRGVMTAIAIGMIPFFVLFLPTPFWKQSLGIVTGFFVWLTAWGVTDAVIHQFAIEYGKRVATEVAEYQLGYLSFINFQTAGQKTLAMFTMIRSSGLMLATVITGMLIKFGGHALSSLSGQLTGAVTHGKLVTPDLTSRGQAEAGLVDGASKHVSAEGQFGNSSMFGHSNHGYGFQSRMEAAMGRQVSQARAFDQLKSDFGGTDGAINAQSGTHISRAIQGMATQNIRQSLGAGEMVAIASADQKALAETAQRHGMSAAGLKGLIASGNVGKQAQIIQTFKTLSGARSDEEAVHRMSTAQGQSSAAQAKVTENLMESFGPGRVAQWGTVGEIGLAGNREMQMKQLEFLGYAKNGKDFEGMLEGQKARNATMPLVLDEERAERINAVMQAQGYKTNFQAGDTATLSFGADGQPSVIVAKAGADREERDFENVKQGVNKERTEQNKELMTVDAKRALAYADDLQKQNPKGFADTIKGIRDIARKGQAVTLSIDKTQDGQYSRVVASAGGNSRLSDERTVETGWARIRRGIEKGEFGTDIQTVNQKKFRGVKEIPHPFKEGETLQVNADETYDPKTGKVVSAMYTNANGGNDVVAMRTTTGPDGKEREEWVVGSYKVNSEGKMVLDDYRSVSKQTKNENGFMVDSFVDTESGKELFKTAQKGQEGKDVRKVTIDWASQANLNAGSAVVWGSDVTNLSDAQRNLLIGLGAIKLAAKYAQDVASLASVKGKVASAFPKSGGGSGGRGGGKGKQSGEDQLADVVAKRAEAAKKGQPPDHSKASPAQEAAYRERDKKAIKELEAKQEAADLKRKYKNPNNPDHKPPSGGETGSNTTPSTSPAPSGSVSSAQGFVEAGSATANPPTPPKPAPGAASSLLAAAPAFSLLKGVPQQHTEAGGQKQAAESPAASIPQSAKATVAPNRASTPELPRDPAVQRTGEVMASVGMNPQHAEKVYNGLIDRYGKADTQTLLATSHPKYGGSSRGRVLGMARDLGYGEIVSSPVPMKDTSATQSPSSPLTSESSQPSAQAQSTSGSTKPEDTAKTRTTEIHRDGKSSPRPHQESQIGPKAEAASVRSAEQPASGTAEGPKETPAMAPSGASKERIAQEGDSRVEKAEANKEGRSGSATTITTNQPPAAQRESASESPETQKTTAYQGIRTEVSSRQSSGFVSNSQTQPPVEPTSYSGWTKLTDPQKTASTESQLASKADGAPGYTVEQQGSQTVAGPKDQAVAAPPGPSRERRANQEPVDHIEKDDRPSESGATSATSSAPANQAQPSAGMTKPSDTSRTETIASGGDGDRSSAAKPHEESQTGPKVEAASAYSEQRPTASDPVQNQRTPMTASHGPSREERRIQEPVNRAERDASVDSGRAPTTSSGSTDHPFPSSGQTQPGSGLTKSGDVAKGISTGSSQRGKPAAQKPIAESRPRHQESTGAAYSANQPASQDSVEGRKDEPVGAPPGSSREERIGQESANRGGKHEDRAPAAVPFRQASQPGDQSQPVSGSTKPGDASVIGTTESGREGRSFAAKPGPESKSAPRTEPVPAHSVEQTSSQPVVGSKETPVTAPPGTSKENTIGQEAANRVENGDRRTEPAPASRTSSATGNKPSTETQSGSAPAKPVGIPGTPKTESRRKGKAAEKSKREPHDDSQRTTTPAYTVETPSQRSEEGQKDEPVAGSPAPSNENRINRQAEGSQTSQQTPTNAQPTSGSTKPEDTAKTGTTEIRRDGKSSPKPHQESQIGPKAEATPIRSVEQPASEPVEGPKETPVMAPPGASKERMAQERDSRVGKAEANKEGHSGSVTTVTTNQPSATQHESASKSPETRKTTADQGMYPHVSPSQSSGFVPNSQTQPAVQPTSRSESAKPMDPQKTAPTESRREGKSSVAQPDRESQLASKADGAPGYTVEQPGSQTTEGPKDQPVTAPPGSSRESRANQEAANRTEKEDRHSESGATSATSPAPANQAQPTKPGDAAGTGPIAPRGYVGNSSSAKPHKNSQEHSQKAPIYSVERPATPGTAENQKETPVATPPAASKRNRIGQEPASRIEKQDRPAESAPTPTTSSAPGNKPPTETQSRLAPTKAVDIPKTESRREGKATGEKPGNVWRNGSQETTVPAYSVEERTSRRSEEGQKDKPVAAPPGASKEKRIAQEPKGRTDKAERAEGDRSGSVTIAPPTNQTTSQAPSRSDSADRTRTDQGTLNEVSSRGPSLNSQNQPPAETPSPAGSTKPADGPKTTATEPGREGKVIAPKPEVDLQPAAKMEAAYSLDRPASHVSAERQKDASVTAPPGSSREVGIGQEPESSVEKDGPGQARPLGSTGQVSQTSDEPQTDSGSRKPGEPAKTTKSEFSGKEKARKKSQEDSQGKTAPTYSVETPSSQRFEERRKDESAIAPPGASKERALQKTESGEKTEDHATETGSTLGSQDQVSGKAPLDSEPAKPGDAAKVTATGSRGEAKDRDSKPDGHAQQTPDVGSAYSVNQSAYQNSLEEQKNEPVAAPPGSSRHSANQEPDTHVESKEDRPDESRSTSAQTNQVSESVELQSGSESTKTGTESAPDSQSTGATEPSPQPAEASEPEPSPRQTEVREAETGAEPEPPVQDAAVRRKPGASPTEAAVARYMASVRAEQTPQSARHGEQTAKTAGGDETVYADIAEADIGRAGVGTGKNSRNT